MVVEKYLTLCSVGSSAKVSFLYNDEKELFAITIENEKGIGNIALLDKDAIQVMIDVTNGVLRRSEE